MTPIATLHYLVVAAALFVLGVIGVLTRRNVVIVLMSIELILNAVNLNLVAFSRIWGLHGQVFAIFVITDAAAEAAVGLGILIAFFRNKETVNVDEIDLLKVVDYVSRAHNALEIECYSVRQRTPSAKTLSATDDMMPAPKMRSPFGVRIKPNSMVYQ